MCLRGSGASKFAQGPQQVRKRATPLLTDFPDPFVRVIAWLLAPIESMLGAVLLLGIWPRAVSIVAGLMLAAFIVVLVRAVGSGRRVSCNCFGATASEPVTWVTVARTAGLGLVSVIVIVGPSAQSAEALAATDRTAWILAVALVWLTSKLVRESWRTQRKLLRLR